MLDRLFTRRAESDPPPAPLARRRIPIFPLQTVLFPGGKLHLKIFEQRYLDMAAACMKDHAPFGVCLLAEGKEVGQTGIPHPVGTLATIASGDMLQLGLLNVALCGGERFRIHSSAVLPDKLLSGEVDILPADASPLPEEFIPLRLLLQQIVHQRGESFAAQNFASAEWVGHRLCEVLPVQWLAKQKLLELDDARSRLEILRTFLKQRGLLK